mgnify:CR=1 FL=1
MTQKDHIRLSDLVLEALVMAIEQKDIAIAEMLRSALELSMTRGGSGKDFIERREFTSEVQMILTRLEALQKQIRANRSTF